jgi:hypothetical protein
LIGKISAFDIDLAADFRNVSLDRQIASIAPGTLPRLRRADMKDAPIRAVVDYLMEIFRRERALFSASAESIFRAVTKITLAEFAASLQRGAVLLRPFRAERWSVRTKQAHQRKKEGLVYREPNRFLAR